MTLQCYDAIIGSGHFARVQKSVIREKSFWPIIGDQDMLLTNHRWEGPRTSRFTAVFDRRTCAKLNSTMAQETNSSSTSKENVESCGEFLIMNLLFHDVLSGIFRSRNNGSRRWNWDRRAYGKCNFKGKVILPWQCLFHTNVYTIASFATSLGVVVW